MVIAEKQTKDPMNNLMDRNFVDGPAGETVYGYLRKQVEEQPEGTAVFDDRRSLTFRELDALADSIAAMFPVHPGVVGVVMNHSVEMIAALFAVLKTGAAYVPVEPSFPKERIPSSLRLLISGGDIGIMQPDGNLLFLYRKDSQVMILGRRVETAEVQNILCGCQEVEKGEVSAYYDEQHLAYLVAYIVPKDRRTFRLSSIRRTMEKFLPSYMIPEFFVLMDTMPVTPNGKVNHTALPVVLKTGDL